MVMISIWIWMFGNMISSMFGSIFIKYYINTNNILWLLGALTWYLLLSFTYINIYMNNDVATSYTVVNMLSIIFITLYSFLFLGESCDLYTCTGLAFCCIGLYILSWNIK